LTTKIHVVADAVGRPLRFILTGGEAERGPKPIQSMLRAASNTQSPTQA
jgi:hypothetical protein